MPNLDRAALREALAQMTPRPWLENGAEATDENYEEVIVESPPHYTGDDFDDPVVGDMDRRKADIAGIVALVNAAPALLDALDAQEKRWEALKAKFASTSEGGRFYWEGHAEEALEMMRQLEADRG